MATPQPAAPASQAVEAPSKVALGQMRRFVAAHGRIIHPSGSPDYDTDRGHKVEVDSWTLIQYEAGKLALDA